MKSTVYFFKEFLVFRRSNATGGCVFGVVFRWGLLLAFGSFGRRGMSRENIICSPFSGDHKAS